ncbi:MAG TPA: hypothetical protein PLK12_05780 [Prolixibacteraceae bacterium]|nr:hypothetical protein [Prolixibacteraceae bacterium]
MKIALVAGVLLDAISDFPPVVNRKYLLLSFSTGATAFARSSYFSSDSGLLVNQREIITLT